MYKLKVVVWRNLKINIVRGGGGLCPGCNGPTMGSPGGTMGFDIPFCLSSQMSVQEMSPGGECVLSGIEHWLNGNTCLT
jgi:hypothetical protein